MGARISAIVITKNNGDKIGECLGSLDFADEIVVVDDFSTDETPRICRRLGATVHSHRFEGFQEQKSHATSLTRNAWVLHLDADERVSEGMREAILGLGAADLERFACFEFRRKTYFWGKWIRRGSLYPDYKPRLFDKTRGRWGGINPHDKFVTDGPTRKVDADILHYQDWDLATYAGRTVLYSGISAREYFRRGRRASWHHVTLRPVYTFLYRYVARLGFLEGMRGLVVAAMGALGTFVKYMRLYELGKGYGKVPVDRGKRD